MAKIIDLSTRKPVPEQEEEFPHAAAVLAHLRQWPNTGSEKPFAEFLPELPFILTAVLDQCAPEFDPRGSKNSDVICRVLGFTVIRLEQFMEEASRAG